MLATAPRPAGSRTSTAVRRAARIASAVFFAASTAAAQSTQLASVSTAGVQGNSGSTEPSVSADGRFVAFQSTATNLVPGDTNGAPDIFVRDLLLGTTERVSVDSAGNQGNSVSANPVISDDGRWVAFRSGSSNLVAGDTNGLNDVFVHDRQTGATERVSVDDAGAEGNGHSFFAAISGDGARVAFESAATNLVVGDTNGVNDVFVRDRLAGTTVRASVNALGTQGNDVSLSPDISVDGRFVAFESLATNLVPGGTTQGGAFVHDLLTGASELVGVDSSGSEGDAPTHRPSISGDGRMVAFDSAATNLVPGDTNGVYDVFVHDRQTGATVVVSTDGSGTLGDAASGVASMSADGASVAFESFAENLVSGDTNGAWDVFVHTLATGATERVSVASAGGEGNGDSTVSTISADGRHVAFRTVASDLVPGDLNGAADVVVRDRGCSSFAESYCTAGTSASGCIALLDASGQASASAGSGFVVGATSVEGQKDGLFFFAQNGRQANPWGNGTSFQCVVPPVQRGGLQPGNGTPGLCDGVIAQDLNARWCATCPKPLQAPVPGTRLQLQFWYRDPLSTSNQTTSLSNALEVDPCP